ncbi:hypothetical protein Smar_0082 [Staphylothermus marinus F1]|uniref:Nucleotide modification associated domain-containing protein n=2 Tax=Staphylothermus marinus TaxID=2280 RepID=A3DKN5_STAMF|nr:hypothetical protein Smar_0082 [Staphylothermus marinus F1]
MRRKIMAKLLILRAFFETSNGGYYSPLNRECYTLLPIPEDLSKLGKTPPHLHPEKIIDQCTGEKLSKFYPIEHNNNPINNDPRLDYSLIWILWLFLEIMKTIVVL